MARLEMRSLRERREAYSLNEDHVLQEDQVADTPEELVFETMKP